MGEILIEMKHIDKSFPGVKALRDVSFDLRAGEVHALLGENGAGKSTLMKIISGIHAPDGGEFLFEGAPVSGLTPKHAQDLGISTIHQELNMCAHLTVAENIFLGREVTHLGRIQQRKMNEQARDVLKSLNLDISPETTVDKLSVSKQQMVEIARATSAKLKVVIMDEPTSALTEREVNELNRIILALRAKGCAIVYITHRLEELGPIADRVTVLRDGQFIATKAYADTSIPEIISLMVGREIKEKFPRMPSSPSDELLRVKGLNAGRLVKDVSFSLRRGEILGFAGLMGAGRTELVRALFGADPIDSGEVVLMGKSVRIANPSTAIRAGIVCVPEDRKKEGLCLSLSIRENIALANLDALSSKVGVVSHPRERTLTTRAIDELKIKTPSPEQDAGNLSGGNQQKVVVGKWLVSGGAQVVIFDEPTRGIDVAAKVEIYHLMNKLKAQGIGVMFISSDMAEVLGMADRILVMCNGRITGEYLSAEATQDKIMLSATQFKVS